MVELSEVKVGQRVRVTFEGEVEAINPNVPGDQVVMLHHEDGYNWVSPGQIEKILPAPIKVGDKVFVDEDGGRECKVLAIYENCAWLEWGQVIPQTFYLNRLTKV